MATISQHLISVRNSILVGNISSAMGLCDTISAEATRLLNTAPAPIQVILRDVISEMGHWQEHLPLLPDDDQRRNLLGLHAVLRNQARNL